MGPSRRPRSDALVYFLEQIALYFEQRLLSRFWFPIHLRPLAPVAGLSPCVGFLGGVLLSRDIVCSCAWLGPARQRRGRFGWWSRPLGLAHAVVLIWSCNSAGADVISRSEFFVVISCGAESGVAAVADRFAWSEGVRWFFIVIFVRCWLSWPPLPLRIRS